MTIAAAIEETYKVITPLYDSSEARNIARYYFEDVVGSYGTGYLLSRSEISRWERDVARLGKGEPLQYVTGAAHFFGYTFLVDEHVLIPRPETEELVARAVQIAKTYERPLRILDIGTGSGCIALSIKQKLASQVMVTAIDISEGAVSLAIDNSQLLDAHVKIRQVDVFDEKAVENLGPFDIIVSNPPYIPPSEAHLMPDQVTKFEPEVALFVAEEDPLLFYRHILSLPSLRRTAKHFLLEINEHLGSASRELAQGLFPQAAVEIHRDLQGKDRIVEVKV